ncbi:hypothetical protein KW789_00305 [Candidatus Saccharibacteria bacterium]|jgi:hypothetical protein|nr:hypothetical protein [Candidatus Saccharibacteria bacterium]
MGANELYNQIVSVTEEYLGPAADRFVGRLVDFHLHKNPGEVSLDDIPKLSEWIKVSLGLLTDDKRMVDECERKILKLAG